MRIELNIAKEIIEPFITINATKQDQTIIDLQSAIEDITQEVEVISRTSDKVVRIPLASVIRFYTDNKRVVCESTIGSYYIQKRIYELVESLSKKQFVKLSSGEIVRTACIREFELSKRGSYLVLLTNGKTTYVSRRCLSVLRKELLK